MLYISKGVLVPWYCGQFDDKYKDRGMVFDKLHKKGVAKLNLV